MAKKTEIVKYSNSMTVDLRGFEAVDLNLFYLACAKVRDRGAEPIEVDFAEVRELIGYKSTSTARLFEDISRLSLKLHKACIGLIVKGEKGRRKASTYGIFDAFDVDEAEQKLTISVKPEYTWMLSDIAKEFTSFELSELVSLGSSYSKKLYRILKQWKTVGHTPEYSVEELKGLLGAPESYTPKRLYNLILKPAIEELKKKKTFSPLWVDVKHKKGRGNPVRGYVFEFAKESIDGQVTFHDIEGFTEIAEGLSKEDKKKAAAIATDIVKGKKKPKEKKLAFVEYEQRQTDYDSMIED